MYDDLKFVHTESLILCCVKLYFKLVIKPYITTIIHTEKVDSIICLICLKKFKKKLNEESK